MQELIKQLEEPRTDSQGNTIGPSNLTRRAANVIKQLLLVKQTDALVIQTLQKEVAELQRELENAKRDFPSNVNNAESSGGVELNRTDSSEPVLDERTEVSGG